MPENAQIPVQMHSFHKIMLITFQARFQQYMKQEISDVQAGFRKGRRTRDQIANNYG